MLLPDDGAPIPVAKKPEFSSWLQTPLKSTDFLGAAMNLRECLGAWSHFGPTHYHVINLESQ